MSKKIKNKTKKVAVRANKQKPEVTETSSEEKRQRQSRGIIAVSSPVEADGTCYVAVSFPRWEAAQRDTLPQFGPPAEKVAVSQIRWRCNRALGETTQVARDDVEKLLMITSDKWDNEPQMI